MPITVRWTWICELCGKKGYHSESSDTYAEQSTSENDVPGWTSWLEVPEEYRDHPVNDICIACPKCKENPDWSKYNG
jgi:hypothetical protein